MGRSVTFNRPDGQLVQGYLAEPKNAAAGAPALVVIQEWWGLNDQIRGVAERFAEQGFRALVPDLYRGKSTVDAEEAHHLMTSLNFGEAAGQDVRGAITHLKASGSAKCGVTGFCMVARSPRCRRCTCRRWTPVSSGTATRRWTMWTRPRSRCR